MIGDELQEGPRRGEVGIVDGVKMRPELGFLASESENFGDVCISAAGREFVVVASPFFQGLVEIELHQIVLFDAVQSGLKPGAGAFGLGESEGKSGQGSDEDSEGKKSGFHQQESSMRGKESAFHKRD